jgi:hypothetical protein
MYERHHIPPITLRRFALRMIVHAGFAMALIGISLLAGIVGYMHYEHMSWLDAFLNSSMLLGGMGPVKTEGLSDPGKFFAGVYALYAGLIFIVVMGIMLAPVIHRTLHLFHWSEK